MTSDWKWPGSRWWKCDLHVHTPASFDFPDRNQATVTDWYNAVYVSRLDAVAVTDHNTGEFVDKVKQLISKGPRPIAIFPGVEISVSPGVHLLAIFDPAKDSHSVTALLGSCGISDAERGTKDAIATCSVTDAMEKAAERGAVCIGAHVNDAKGILMVVQPGQSLQHIITSDNLHAVEVNLKDGSQLQYLDNTKDGYKRLAGSLSIVTFSDAHSLSEIGSRFTWIKMTRPDLEGLRLAFQDGPLSVVGFDKMIQDPNSHASLALESLEIQDSKYIGRGTPFTAEFNPWLNAIIGGRGTGKSSLVEFLRIALRRESELPEELQKDFEDFKRIPRTRDDNGLLTDNAQARVVYRKEGKRFRIQWDYAGTLKPIQEEVGDDSWHEVEGEVRGRFPIRIYSQKQIFEMAKDPEALLRIIDDAPEVNRATWNEEWHQEEARFMALRAKAREIGFGLAEEGRIKGELADVKRKLEVFESSGHSEVLREYQHRKRQSRTVEAWQEGFDGIGNRLREVAAQGAPETVDLDGFDQESDLDGEVLNLAQDASALLRELMQKILGLAGEADRIANVWKKKLSESGWRRVLGQAETNYTSLVEKLRGAEAGDPTEYGRLVQERQRFEQRLAGVEGRRKTLMEIQKQVSESLTKLSDLRRNLTESRSQFLKSVVGSNPHVRVEIVPYGDANSAEPEFRSLIGKDKPIFQSDILTEDNQSGVLADLYRRYPSTVTSNEFEARLKKAKYDLFSSLQRLAGPQTFQDKRFAKHISSLKPEAFDRLEYWFPCDSLKVSYSPHTDGQIFRPIEQGSPGQKTAAILAFLLSYGEQPMVLDQPEDDLDNHLIYDLIVRQLREKKRHRQLIVVTHNPNIVVNGDAELVLALDVRSGQTRIAQRGGLQEQAVRDEICRVMEGGREAFELRYRRIGQGASHV